MDLQLIFASNIAKLDADRKKFAKRLSDINLKIASAIKFYSYLLPGTHPELSVQDPGDFEEAAATLEGRRCLCYEIYLRSVAYEPSKRPAVCLVCNDTIENSFFTVCEKGRYICSNECHYENFLKTADGIIAEFLEDSSHLERIKEGYYNEYTLYEITNDYHY